MAGSNKPKALPSASAPITTHGFTAKAYSFWVFIVRSPKCAVFLVIGRLQQGLDVELLASLRQELIDEREHRGRRYVDTDRDRVVQIVERDHAQLQRCGRIALEDMLHLEFVAVRRRHLALVEATEQGI